MAARLPPELSGELLAGGGDGRDLKEVWTMVLCLEIHADLWPEAPPLRRSVSLRHPPSSPSGFCTCRDAVMIERGRNFSWRHLLPFLSVFCTRKDSVMIERRDNSKLRYAVLSLGVLCTFSDTAMRKR